MEVSTITIESTGSTIGEEISILLGSAAVYQAAANTQPYWDPEEDYRVRHSRADGNPVQ